MIAFPICTTFHYRFFLFCRLRCGLIFGDILHTFIYLTIYFVSPFNYAVSFAAFCEGEHVNNLGKWMI